MNNVGIFFPLQVVFATSGIQSQEMPGKRFAVYTVFFPAQPVTAFQSAHQYLHGIFVAIEQPPRKHILGIHGSAIPYRNFDFHIRHQGGIEQQVCFQGEQRTFLNGSYFFYFTRPGHSLYIPCYLSLYILCLCTQQFARLIQGFRIGKYGSG